MVAMLSVVVTAAAVVAVTELIFELNVIQSVLVNKPRLEDEAFGILNVWVVPLETMLKSGPNVPMAKVCVEPVSPFKDLMVFPVNRFKSVVFLTVLSSGFHVKMESEIAPEKGYFNLKAGRIALFPLSTTNRAL